MDITIIGKFPPIEGGVSASTFWAAKALSENGNNVHVVTNAIEVEGELRQYLTSNELEDQISDSSLTIHNTSTIKQHSYIPWAEPFASKLLGLALSVIRKYDSDIIIGWYFEPYGLVASIIGSILNKPVILKHAGSDIGRLALHPNLMNSYKWMIGQADYIISPGRIDNHLIELGASKEQLTTLRGSRLPRVFLHPDQAIDIGDLAANISDWISNVKLKNKIAESISEMNKKHFDKSIITIGIYGKVGKRKGSYALIDALSTLAKKEVEFNFVPVVCGHRSMLIRYYEYLLSKPHLCNKTWIIPPLPPWKIPAYLQACNVTCVLENRFPISFHHPRLPREILSSGSCLVCSEEIADKNSFRSSLVDDKNFILIPDPENIDYLSQRIENIISEDRKAEMIGKHGRYLSTFFEEQLPEIHPFSKFVECLNTASRNNNKITD